MAVKFKDTININGQYTLPLTDGTDGQVLVTDGSGNLTFSSESIAGSADSAESTHLNVKNTSGASIAKGTPVYVTGSVGNTDKLEIAPADASNASHMPAIGLLESTLANNGEGFVVQGGLLKGLVTDTIDGSASTANDTVYVKAGGGLTLTKPTGSTNFIQNIAKVARVHNGNGSLIVSSILRTNDVPNLSTGKIWVGDSNTIESTVVHIDETNGRLGIGTDSPELALHILKSGENNGIRIITDNTYNSIIHFGDSEDNNIGRIVYSHPDNAMKFFTNDADHVVIDSIGRMGIGTDSPTEKLHVLSSGNISRFESTTATSNVVIKNSTTTTKIGSVSNNFVVDLDPTNAVASSNIILKSDGTERARFKSSGDISFRDTSINEAFYWDASAASLGIGTTSPLSKLHIENTSGNDGIRIINSTTGEGYIIFGDTADNNTGSIAYNHASDAMTFDINNSERMRIDSSGRVGIGTTSPNTILDVRGADALMRVAATNATGEATLELRGLGSNGTSNAISRIKSIPEGGGTAASLAFTTRNSSGTNIERLRIDSSGNVGIGTTSPGGKLDIKTPMGTSGRFDGAQLRLESTNTVDTTGFQGIRFATSTTPNYGWSMGANRSGSGRGSFRFFEHINSITGVERFTIKQDGNVGIGTTNPQNTLHLGDNANASAGTLRIDSFVANQFWKLEPGTNTLNIKDYHGTSLASFNGANNYVLFNGGNVGIGTTSPSQKLTVVGNAYIAGGLLLLDDNQPIQWGNSQQKIIGNNSGYLQFITSNSERMRIDSSGTVQITKPATAGIVEGLVVMNPINTAGTGHGASILLHSTPGAPSRGVKIASSSTSNFALDNDMLFYTSASQTLTEKMRITSAGNVGIGTNSPNNPLHITSSSAVLLNAECTGASSFIQLTNSGGAAGVKSTSNELILWTSTSGTERLRIDSSGRVGIGTDSPDAPLTVKGETFIQETSGGNAALRIQYGVDGNTALRDRARLMSVGYHGKMELIDGYNQHTVTISSTGNSYLNGGNVGIGTTSPSHNLTINSATGGQLQFQYNTLARLRIEADSGGGSYYAAAGFYHRFFTSGVERMRISSGGEILFGGITSIPDGTSTYGVGFASITSNVQPLHFASSTTSAKALIIFKNPNGTVGDIRTSGSATAYNTSGSDLRLKKNIEDWNENVLDSFASIQPKEFHFNVQDDNEEKVKGYIAQDNVDKFPEAYPQNEDGFYSYNPSGMVVYLMKAIQELKAEIETLKSQIQ